MGGLHPFRRHRCDSGTGGAARENSFYRGPSFQNSMQTIMSGHKSQNRSRVAFIAARTDEPWGGSEELWSQAAIRLVADGVTVAACVHGHQPLHERLRELRDNGVKLWPRPEWYSRRERICRFLSRRGKSDLLYEVEKFLDTVRPELAVLSTGAALPAIELVELCQSEGVPFVTIGQANSEGWWFDDTTAARYRRGLPYALRCFFVSKANLRLAEKQIGEPLLNAEVVHNPFNVDFNSLPPWPYFDETVGLHLACVGRLDPFPKGQDILLEVLAQPAWMNRHWRLTLYGNGAWKNGIERLVQHFELERRVTLAGYVSRVEDIWAGNHVLVMPSRLEGLPLAMVEAMLCGRPVVATDVAGHSEIIEDGVSGFLADAPTVKSMAEALERLWERRNELKLMGEIAAKKIRKCVPPDPAKVFATKIQHLLKPADRSFGSS
jgi:glycosyltransferase involved in cell wall biosynthesis